ncbi:hypothetical protein ACQY0O_000184 [Thecaphora frezii]
MNATVVVDRSAPRIMVATSFSGVDLQEYVPVALVRNGVTYIILYSMFATLLFVLLCAVLFKNGLSPQKRRLPVVWVLGLAMLGGLLGSTLNTVFWAYQLFGNAGPGSIYRLWMASTAMLYITPLVTHVAVQLRMMSFYPPTLASPRKRIAIVVFPTLAKIARAVLIVFTLVLSSSTYLGMTRGWADGGSKTDEINLSIFILQLADTLYASCILLWKFHCLGRRDKELMHENSHWSLGWLKQIMYALAFGYVLPTAYSLALVICKVVNIDPTALGYVLVANVYIQAFGAVLATLSRSHRWREDRFTSSYRPELAADLPRTRRAQQGAVSMFSDDTYRYDVQTLATMHEARRADPVSFESTSSLNATELGLPSPSPSGPRSGTSNFRLKRLTGGRPVSSERNSTSSRRFRGSASSAPRIEVPPLPSPLPTSPPSASGLPSLSPTTATAPTGVASLQQVFSELPASFEFEQFQKRRSSDATLISGTDHTSQGHKTFSSFSGDPVSSDASASSSHHSSRPYK